MSRTRYERPEDVANEYAAIAKFSVLFPGAEVTRLSDEGHAFTVLSKKGAAKVVVEIKTRHISSVKYPTFMISKQKYDALCALHEKGLRCGILVQWTDKLGFATVPTEYTTNVGGRTDRGDPRDIEPMVYINTKRFERVGGSRI